MYYKGLLRCIVFLCLLAAYSTSYALDNELKDEIKLGRSIASVIAGTYGIDKNEELIRYVNLVGNTIALSNGRSELNYYFSILDTDSINAFACPGGYIFITRGLLKSLSSEAELAGVLAHEIAHVNHKHVLNALIQKRSSSVDSFVAKMLGSQSVSFSVAFNQVVSKGLEILFQKGLPYNDEYEADACAIFYLESCGYNQNAYYDVLNRVLRNPSAQQKYSSTHPPTEERLKHLEALININVPSGQDLKERYQQYVIH